MCAFYSIYVTYKSNRIMAVLSPSSWWWQILTSISSVVFCGRVVENHGGLLNEQQVPTPWVQPSPSHRGSSRNQLVCGTVPHVQCHRSSYYQQRMVEEGYSCWDGWLQGHMHAGYGILVLIRICGKWPNMLPLTWLSQYVGATFPPV